MQQPENPFVTINQFLSSIDKKIDELKKNQMEINADSDPSKLMTITEASKFLNLSKSAIYSKTSKRLIPFVKRGKQLYFIDRKSVVEGKRVSLRRRRRHENKRK